jgi:3-hydroxyisobutyrate dehydrogenase-like beta-hydroxyacid dehydrogenase
VESEGKKVLSMKKNIGFIGTGLMGRGMVRSLIRKGFSVRVYNRTRAKAVEAAEGGGLVAESPAEAARHAEVIITMLADPAAVFAVLPGILEVVSPGAVLIDSSTVSPQTSLAVREQLRAKGAEMIDAPVFGSKNEAEKGELGFIVGGEKEIIAKVQDVLDAMGRTIQVGKNGMGAYTKLVVNQVIANTMLAFNEGMVLAAKAGLDPAKMVEVILSSRAKSGIIEMKAPGILKRDFSAFFPMKLMAKDIRLVLEAAKSEGVSMPLTEQVKNVFDECLAKGLGDQDFSATIKWLEEKSGLQSDGQKGAV